MLRGKSVISIIFHFLIVIILNRSMTYCNMYLARARVIGGSSQVVCCSRRDLGVSSGLYLEKPLLGEGLYKVSPCQGYPKWNSAESYTHFQGSCRILQAEWTYYRYFFLVFTRISGSRFLFKGFLRSFPICPSVPKAPIVTSL